MSEQRRHPPKEDLARFIRADLESSRRNDVVGHLLKGCDACAAALSHKPSIREVVNYEKCMNRVEMACALFETNIETERQLGFQLWDLLDSKTAESRLLIVRNDRRFQIWGLFDHILGKIRPTSRKDPFGAVDLAHLAVTITQLLVEEDYGSERLHDFRGAAYNLLGFAMRNAGDFVGAKSAFEGARTELQQGTGDPIEAAMLAVHSGSLLFDLGEFAGALRLLNDAIRLFRRAGDSHGMGLTFVKQAMILAHTATPEKGLLLAEKGLSLLDLGGQPRGELAAHDARAWCYNALGDHEEALRIVSTHEYLYKYFDDEPAIQGKHEWLLGRIQAGRRELGKSLRHLNTAYQVFLGAFLYFDAVLVDLNRIEVLLYLRQGAEAMSIANRLAPLLEAWGLGNETLRLWAMMTTSIAAGEFLVKQHSHSFESHLRKHWIPRPTGADFASRASRRSVQSS